MPELLTVYTVPDESKLNTKKKVSVDLEKIVGVLAPDGRDLWAKHNPKKWHYRGRYKEGYSKQDIAEKTISLPSTMSARFTEFFEAAIVRGKQRATEEIPTYDCHWLAFWMKGLLDKDDSLYISSDLAKHHIRTADPVNSKLGAGDVGVLGGNAETYGMRALHSFTATDRSLALQSMGVDGIIAIGRQDRSVEYYEALAPLLGYHAESGHGVRVLRNAPEADSIAA